MKRSCLSDQLLRLDLLAPDVHLGFNGATGLRTWFGVGMTALYLGVVAALSWLVFRTYLDTTKPTVLIEQTEVARSHRVDFLEHKLLPVFFMIKDETHYLRSEDVSQYFSLQFSQYSFSSAAEADGTPKLTAHRTVMAVVPCKQLAETSPAAFAHYLEYSDDPLFSRYGLEFGLCVDVDPAATFISGLGGEPTFDFLAYQVFPCSLSAGCATVEEVRRVGLAVASPTKSLNVSSLARPVRSALKIDNIYFVNEGLKQKYQPRFIRTSIRNEFQDLLDYFPGRKPDTSHFGVERALQTHNFRHRDAAQTTCTRQQIRSGDCSAYFQLEFLSSAQQVQFVRIYKSLTRTLSEI